ncbi:MAG: T9SS type A sorting domain-containing protein [Bacteroidales bacterium]|nr:T9SS type A sorting domain-containing protein [Bacteroidales bacterium]
MKKATILFIRLFVPLVIYAQNIEYAEFFIDSDPGYGMATPITVSSAGSDISLNFSEDLSSLQQGIHYLGIRVRDDLGGWSQGANTLFYLVKTTDVIGSNIDRAEYFMDTDPGFGMAVSIPVPAPGNDLALQLNPGLLGLDQGLHYIQFRARDVSGRWGSVINAIFLLVELPSSVESDIQQVEYFIDTDPGYGLGTAVTLPSAGSDLSIDFSVSLSGLSDGDHVLYIRAENGMNKWGLIYAESFVYSSTGIGKEGISPLFKIYPNPSGGLMQVEWSGQAPDGLIIRLMDMNGKLLYETICPDKTCELDLDLSGGMYLLNIENSEQSITQKIIIE